MTDRELMQQALEALTQADGGMWFGHQRVITDLREGLSQPVQEPRQIKTWRQRCEAHPDHDGIVSDRMIQARMQEEIDELRDALEPRQWQGLTDEQMKAPIQKAMKNFGYDPDQYSLGHSATLHLQWLAKEIETKLRERNS